MVRALTRQKRDGSLYVRRAATEQRLNELAALDRRALLELLRITDRAATGHVPGDVVGQDLQDGGNVASGEGVVGVLEELGVLVGHG